MAMENTVQYITSKEGLKSALIDVLSELKLIQPSTSEIKAPATRAQACKFLNISIPTLSRLINSKQLTAFNIGRQIRIDWSELERYVTSQGSPNYLQTA
jgi:excisionase family DNA binding protein